MPQCPAAPALSALATAAAATLYWPSPNSGFVVVGGVIADTVTVISKLGLQEKYFSVRRP